MVDLLLHLLEQINFLIDTMLASKLHLASAQTGNCILLTNMMI